MTWIVSIAVIWRYMKTITRGDECEERFLHSRLKFCYYLISHDLQSISQTIVHCCKLCHMDEKQSVNHDDSYVTYSVRFGVGQNPE